MIKKYLFLISLTLSLFAFQNCSEVAFNPENADFSEKADDNQDVTILDDKDEDDNGENGNDDDGEDHDADDNDGEDQDNSDQDGDNDGEDQDDGDDNDQSDLDEDDIEDILMDDETLRCDTENGGRGIVICHVPPGNPDNRHTICIGAPAWPAHSRHHGEDSNGNIIYSSLGYCEDQDDD